MSDTDIRRARAAFVWVGVIVPLGILGVSFGTVAAWLSELPDPVAVHWSGGGPDGFAPPPMLLITPLIGIALVLLFAATALFAHRLPPAMLSGGGGVVSDRTGQPQWSVTARFLGAMNLGLSVFMGVLSLVTAGVQRGLDDAADAPEIMPWTFAGFGILAVVAVIGWFLQPNVAPAQPRPADPGTVPLGAGERVVWFGSASMARAGQVVVGVAVLLMAGLTAYIVATAADTGEWWPAAIMVVATLLVLVAAGSGFAFRVRVNADGLRVRSVVGWPDTRIPIADIARVEVVPLNPFAEFGGWGWRLAMDGRRGVVLRAGEALQVTRVGGTVFVVTVDGAREAAAVLETLRAAKGPGSEGRGERASRTDET
ncbi:DUF1648 domain-containing protein [Microbacterium resistens]|uniref:DUF1648 domain-containing protein n=1 Tax=Microbacterium resistens TaxID=156977 RepID=A0ABY3RRU4_9MICO|nr:DUF1648 domain-containing protein [Microbacterium resistens]UGS26818.1 DUF1648 domain-containing protein [Microbacterium resistens]